MLEYKLISSVSQKEFSQDVNLYLAQGWIFHGDTKVVQNGHGAINYYQAFTREKRN